jgi:type IV pilus assembly protein PilV
MLTQRTLTTQRGLTLTETLTALVLLAIGVLCIATVYLERSQAAPAVLLHSKANRLAVEMAERMRARRTDQVHFENPVGVRCNPELSDAPTQQLVTNDIACWQEKVVQTLPNGSGAIAHDNRQTLRTYLITVSWSPPDRGTASFLLRVELPGEELLIPPPGMQPKTAGGGATTSEVRAARAAD